MSASVRRASPAVAVTDRGRPRTSVALVRSVVRTVLAFGGRPDLAVSLLLTDDREIAELHARWFHDPAPTDVISFADDGEGAEIVVSVQTARRIARQRGHQVRAEVALYLVHGLLHVLGYDDTTKAARARMRRAERTCLQRLGLVVAAVDS